MSRHKSRRIASFLSLSNTFDAEKKLPPKMWSVVFGNNHPLVLELGAGHGTYTLALAERQPEYNYIGIDRQSPRLLVGARQAVSAGLMNVAFLRAPIERLNEVFTPHSIAEIWLPFPDPYPKARQAKKRLTASRFLEMYRELLITPILPLVGGGRRGSPERSGVVHLKTDNPALYQFTLESVSAVGGSIKAAYPDIDQVKNIDSRILIQTPYEQTHRAAGRQIGYVRFGWKKML